MTATATEFDQAAEHLISPPRPKLTLAVGVVGHRPNRLPKNAREGIFDEIKNILKTFHNCLIASGTEYREYFADNPPYLSVVTALAEGSDSIAAAAAVEGGFSLDVIVPFPLVDYEKDFSSQASKLELRELWSAAHRKVELPGSRNEAAKSYEVVGIAILDQCDVLIAVWDGGPSAGRGGTADMVKEAARRGMPVIHIDATRQSPTRLLWRNFKSGPSVSTHIDDQPAVFVLQGIPTVVDSLIRTPKDEREVAALRQFFAEKSHRQHTRMEYPLLLALLGVKRPRSRDFWPMSPWELARDVPGTSDQSSQTLLRSFGWADATAVYFAQAFRSAFVANFIFSALAIVTCIAIPTAPGTILDLIFVAILVTNTFVGQRSHWHRRWIEAREVAERLRVAIPMQLLATRPLGLSAIAPTWTTWYVRAILRTSGIISSVIDTHQLDRARSALLHLIADQKTYHYKTARSLSTVHDRLASFGKILFVLALVVAFSQIILQYGLFPSRELMTSETATLIGSWTLILSIGLPTLGSACYGIRLIGDFDGGASRASRMEERLGDLAGTLEAAPSDLATLRAHAHIAAEIMLGDVASWRLVVESRALEIPG